MKFELDDSQTEKLEAWQEKIKDLYGKCGNFSYIFTPTGIGNVVIVKSELTGLELDLTEIDKW